MATNLDTAVPILDIRPGPTEFDILQDIRSGLRPENGGEKRLPTLLLYDEAGLRLFEKITYLDEYYLTNAEIEVLETYADRIAKHIEPGSVVVELGSGNLRKVNILLQAIDRAAKPVEYYAVDLSLPELKRTFSEIPTAGYKHVKCFGLYGTYDHALEWLKSDQVRGKPKTILWLGSSLGNFQRSEVAPFLAGFREALQVGDTMLIGIDSCKDSSRVFHAYNDREGVTHQFTLNGLKHANNIMEDSVFKLEDWEAIGEYDVKDGGHHAFVSPLKDVVVDGVSIPQGERVRIEESNKFSRQEILDLWEGSQLAANTVFTNSRGDYGLHLVSKPRVFFSSKPEDYAAKPVPSISDWEQMWTAWDAVSRGMIPEEELKTKPIKLRNECIFYLGHIPAFLDIHISRATSSGPTEPAYFHRIFERGIDPDVDNPEICHSHSEVPDAWPPLKTIVKYQQDIRHKIKDLYATKASENEPRVARALWLGFEHEAMHLETLLYMLVQSKKVLAPPDTTSPDFEALSRRSELNAVENEWFTVPESKITLGLEDAVSNPGTDEYFGWDNEKPTRSVRVGTFQAKARPITNGEYAEYLSTAGKTTIPASWHQDTNASGKGHNNSKRDSVLNGVNGAHESPNGAVRAPRDLAKDKYVRTVYGLIPLEHALNWPVAASYDELVGCAQWMGGRIPTLEEARSIYSYVDRSKVRDVEQAIGTKIPAVNGHLLNDGVEETPPSRILSNGVSSAASGSPNPQELFVDLGAANVGFKHWHPVSVAEKGNQLCGQSDLGGVWEWTSTVLEKHDGFEPMELYPGYTADFFDGKHNITLGGSWATHPRLAGRKTFVNWYQRNYPYVWAGARLVRDV
ncbi:C-type lectin protein [Dendryphion nanum]|uniref:C-type lectin protein n=1 Tax=Dendryphion nanum TaxID=256645 RepID=A0A9P9E3V5_9PLEO|nr:C-type lectin protein [Dendryphion nanum]